MDDVINFSNSYSLCMSMSICVCVCVCVCVCGICVFHHQFIASVKSDGINGGLGKKFDQA